MKKVIVEAEVSLDGVMGGDPADFWKQIFAFHSADVQQYLDELLLMPDALLMGRETYQGFAQVWPTRIGKMADRINAMPKYVASRTLKAPLEWNAALLEGDVADAIKKLKQQDLRLRCRRSPVRASRLKRTSRGVSKPSPGRRVFTNFYDVMCRN
jgi:dihydrofolate reductase